MSSENRILNGHQLILFSITYKDEDFRPLLRADAGRAFLQQF